jgi:hypothetical protein
MPTSHHHPGGTTVSYHLNLAEDGTYIVLTMTGEVNRELAMQYNLDAHAMGRKLGIRCYLVDATGARNTDTVFNTYEFAYSDMTAFDGIDRTARVAMVVASDDHSHDFVETVARNAGLDVTLFTDRRLAEEHLRRT